MKKLIMLVILMMGLLVGSAAADPVPGDHWICESAAIYSFAPGAMQAEWNDPAQTWRVLETNDPATPADDVWHLWANDESVFELGILYAHPELGKSGPAYIDYYDTDTGLLWRFAFKDLIPTNEGGRYGHHHSCEQGPVVFNLARGDDHG